MADNYTQLSTLLDIKNGQKVMDILDTLSSLEDMTEEESNCLTDDWITLRTNIEDFGNPASLSVQGETSDTLWVCAEEECNLEATAMLMQKMLQEEAVEPNHPRGILIEWASTCSKLRAGQFGGGAFLATADKVVWREDASNWAMTKGT